MGEASAGLQIISQEQVLFHLQKLCDPNTECALSGNCIFPFLILGLLHEVFGKSIPNVSNESQHQDYKSIYHQDSQMQNQKGLKLHLSASENRQELGLIQMGIIEIQTSLD